MPTKKKPDPAAIVTAILEGYAEKAVFRGFSTNLKRDGKATYRMIWHYDRPVELQLDVPKKTLRFPALLSGVPARSAMYRELKAFLDARRSDQLPEHRRANPAKVRLASASQRGVISISITARDGDFDYATRKIIQIIHEIFMVFLVDGPYFDYMVEHLGLDPDRF